MTSYQISYIVNHLLSSPTSTTLEIIHGTSKVFPAVTICNLNPLKLQAVNDSRDIDHIHRKLYELLQERPWNLSNISLTTPAHDGIFRAEFLLQQKTLFLMNYLNLAAFLRLSYRITDLLADCTFAGKRCRPSDFFRLRNPYLGSCYIFNRSPDPLQWQSVNQSGPTSGLSLTLFLDERSYLPRVSTELGYKIVIHEQKLRPEPHRDGFFIRPGLAASFGIRANRFIRARPPYGNCKTFTTAENRFKNHILYQLPALDLTADLCRSTCHQLELLKQCNCHSFTLGFVDGPPFYHVPEKAKSRLCSVEPLSEEARCMNRVEEEVKAAGSPCRVDCNFQLCEITNFDVRKSSAVWPTMGATNDVAANIMQSTLEGSRLSLQGLSGKDKRNAYLRNNFLKIQVYFQDLDTTVSTTGPTYSILSFLADVGGIVGLWLGCSMLSIIELFEFLFDISSMLIRNRKLKKGLEN